MSPPELESSPEEPQIIPCPHRQHLLEDVPRRDRRLVAVPNLLQHLRVGHRTLEDALVHRVAVPVGGK